MAEWSSRKQWWMDLLKWAIGFTVGSFVSLMVLDYISQQRMKELYKWQSEYGIKLSVTRDFEKAAKKYNALAPKALKAAMCRDTADNPTDLVEWKNQAYNDLLFALESLEYWFDSTSNKRIKEALADFEKIQKKLSDIEYKVYVSDCRTPKGKVRIYHESKWDEYVKNEITPVILEYNNALRLVLSEAKNSLSSK